MHDEERQLLSAAHMTARRELRRTTRVRGASLPEYAFLLVVILLVAATAYRALGGRVEASADRVVAVLAGSGAGGAGEVALGGASRAGEGGGFGAMVRDFFDGLIRGDAAANDNGATIVGQIVGGLIPVYGQLADLRDIGIAITGIVQGREGAGRDLILAGIGVIPGAGDAIKGAVRGGDEILGAASRGADAAMGAAGRTARRALDEIAELPRFTGKSASEVADMMRDRGYTMVPSFDGTGQIWLSPPFTDAAGNTRTVAVRIDPPNPRAIGTDRADAVWHAHKEVVDTSRLLPPGTPGGYPNSAVVGKYDDMGLLGGGDYYREHIPLSGP